MRGVLCVGMSITQPERSQPERSPAENGWPRPVCEAEGNSSLLMNCNFPVMLLGTEYLASLPSTQKASAMTDQVPKRQLLPF